MMDKTASGWMNGFLGMLIFSGSLPATRVAVAAFDPVFLTVARAGIAGLLGLALLLVFRQKRPERSDLISLAVVACGVVIGFPLLTALALKHITAAHSVVFVALLPLSTAIFGVLRGGEHPRPAFWLFSGFGALLVAGFALARGTGASPVGDLLMFAAIIVCGLGYAEGVVAAYHGAAGADHHAVDLGRRGWIGMDGPCLCVFVQHVDRLCLLVPRAGSGRYCGSGAVAITAAVLRTRACRDLVA
jgi:drug/metabolite transporter (DMT)-like permease